MFCYATLKEYFVNVEGPGTKNPDCPEKSCEQSWFQDPGPGHNKNIFYVGGTGAL